MYQYLKKLKIDLENLRIQVSQIPEESWQHWTNPRGKVVGNYKQVYLKDTDIDLKHILDQIPGEYGPVSFLRYDPFSNLHPHVDWNNKSAILIGITNNSSIIFWDKLEKTIVPYTSPIIANLEEVHSVENDISEFRFVLKIPFKLKYQDVIQQINELM